LKQDSIARQDVDTQAATVHQLEATVVGSKAAEGTARLNLSYTRIVSPIEGRVGLRAVDVGNQVSTSDANGVGMVTKLTPSTCSSPVPQDHASWLQHNAGAYMDVKAYDRTRITLLDDGVFASLDNQIDTTTGTVMAKARFNNSAPAAVSQPVRQRASCSCASSRTRWWCRWRRCARAAPANTCSCCRTTAREAAARGARPDGRRPGAGPSGLQIGEKVITEGADRLRDGARVLPAGDTPGAGQGGRRRGGASCAAGRGLERAAGCVGAFHRCFAAQNRPRRAARRAQREATAPFAARRLRWAPPRGERELGRRPPRRGRAGGEGTASCHAARWERAQPRGTGPAARGIRQLSPEERAKRREEFQKRRQAAEAGGTSASQ
jgi:multidrug efflux system membrane fusion protein